MKLFPALILKDPSPEWFIEVTEVDGTKLKKPVRIVFSNETGDQIVNLKEDSLGLEFAAYETGNFLESLTITPNLEMRGLMWDFTSKTDS